MGRDRFQNNQNGFPEVLWIGLRNCWGVGGKWFQRDSGRSDGVEGIGEIIWEIEVVKLPKLPRIQ